MMLAAKSISMGTTEMMVRSLRATGSSKRERSRFTNSGDSMHRKPLLKALRR